MDEIDRKALYWCLKLSRMAVYNQLFTESDPVELRKGVDHKTAAYQKHCLEKARKAQLELGRELGIGDD